MLRAKPEKSNEIVLLVEEHAARFVHSCIAAQKSDEPLKAAYLAAENATLSLKNLCDEHGVRLYEHSSTLTREEKQNLYKGRLKRFNEGKAHYERVLKPMYQRIRNKFFVLKIDKNKIAEQEGVKYFRVYEAIKFEDNLKKISERKTREEIINSRVEGKGTVFISNKLSLSNYAVCEASFEDCYKMILAKFDAIIDP